MEKVAPFPLLVYKYSCKIRCSRIPFIYKKTLMQTSRHNRFFGNLMISYLRLFSWTISLQALQSILHYFYNSIMETKCIILATNLSHLHHIFILLYCNTESTTIKIHYKKQKQKTTPCAVLNCLQERAYGFPITSF